VSNWDYLNGCRIAGGPYASTPMDGFSGAFTVIVCHEWLRIIASDGYGWRHVSVSRRDSHKPPTWEMMCAVKDLFWEAEDWVVQFHPARSEYINNHPGCLHLWQCMDRLQPTPESALVGLKRRFAL
jgi:hypothetical protein